MTENISLSSAEVCELFEISKSTLFRWEKEKRFPKPLRDSNNQRLYSIDQIKAINERKRYSQYEKFTATEDPNNISNLKKIHIENSLYKLIIGNAGGIKELKEHGRLEPDEIITAIKILLRCHMPDSIFFCETIEMIANKCKLLQK